MINFRDYVWLGEFGQILVRLVEFRLTYSFVVLVDLAANLTEPLESHSRTSEPVHRSLPNSLT